MNDVLNDDYTIDDLTSMKQILEMAIRREEDSHAFYKTAADKAETKARKEMFMRMAEEEIGHREKLQRELEGILAQLEIDKAISHALSSM